MTSPVFISETLVCGGKRTVLPDFSVGQIAELNGSEGHHASKVTRLGIGEELDIVDGYGFKLSCTVTALTETGLVLRIEDVYPYAPSRVSFTLVQALAKGGRDEQAVETCTELGAERFIPWQADRSIVRWVGPKSSKGRKKWENQAVSAAKQSRRTTVPTIEELQNTTQLVEHIKKVIKNGGLVLLCHEEATEGIRSLLDTHNLETQLNKENLSTDLRYEIIVIVGPEGGISSEEANRLMEAGAQMVSLGANVLRSSTAGAVALAILNYRYSDQI